MLPRLLLTGLLLAPSAHAQMTFTALHGAVSALEMKKGVQRARPAKRGEALRPGHSYLTPKGSQAIFVTNDGTWLRLGSESKIEVSAEGIRLLTGSLRVLHAPRLQRGDNESRAFHLSTPDARLTTHEAKFTLTYRPVTRQTAAYVEKGLVTLTRPGASSEAVLIHGGEYAENLGDEVAPRRTLPMTPEKLALIKKLMLEEPKSKKDAL